ncbi:hypothetical protein [Nostoc sp.]
MRRLTLTLDDLKDDLEDKLTGNLTKLGEKHYYVMQCSYLRYTLTNNQELTELLAESITAEFRIKESEFRSKTGFIPDFET